VHETLAYTGRAEAVERMTFGADRSPQGTVHVRRGSTRQVYLVSSFILDELRKPLVSPATRDALRAPGRARRPALMS
jgi:hypothetical protein